MKVLPHERFRLVEDDVHLDVPLTLRPPAAKGQGAQPVVAPKVEMGLFIGDTSIQLMGL